MTARRPVLSLNLLLVAASFVGCPAWADDAADCQAAAGSYLTGVVLETPTFAHGSRLHGVELSHTHVKLLGDADARTYDVAVDDVFASGYRPRQETVPAPLSGIKPGDHLSLCGIPFKGGMHWVHTNCGDTPTPQDPDGWLKEIAADGSTGASLESSTAYCYLWPRR